VIVTATFPTLILVSVPLAMTSSLKVNGILLLFLNEYTLQFFHPKQLEQLFLFSSDFHEYEEHDTNPFGHGMIHNHFYHSHLNGFP